MSKKKFYYPAVYARLLGISELISALYPKDAENLKEIAEGLLSYIEDRIENNREIQNKLEELIDVTVKGFPGLNRILSIPDDTTVANALEDEVVKEWVERHIGERPGKGICIQRKEESVEDTAMFEREVKETDVFEDGDTLYIFQPLRANPGFIPISGSIVPPLEEL